MEENKDFTPSEDILPEKDAAPEENATASDEAAGAVPPAEEQVPEGEQTDAEADATQTPSSEEEAPAEEELPAQEESPAPWDFGEDEPRKKSKGKGAFFGVFSAVLAVCLALLIGLMFLGENGFHIVRTIEILRTVYTKEDGTEDGLLSMQEAADTVARSTVTVLVYTATEGTGGTHFTKASGSGFVYDDKGHICTNHHVIDGATHVQIVLADGTVRDAQIVGSDERSDLAVLKVDPAGLLPAKLGASSALLVGDSVVAVGAPLGIELSGTATFGKVSAVDRWIAVDDNSDGTYEKKIRVIQTDTSVNPGNSGGPMADMYGRIVGVVVRKMTGKEAIGFAIPIDGAKIVLDAIVANGSFTGQNPLAEGRSLIGVTGHGGQQGLWYTTDDLTGSVQSSPVEKEGYYQMPANGVYVMSVDGQNAKGVLRRGDVILSVNGMFVFDTSALIDAVNLYRVGQKITLGVFRDGATVSVQITLAEG